MKKLISLFTASLMLFASFSFTAFAADTTPGEYTGAWDSNDQPGYIGQPSMSENNCTELVGYTDGGVWDGGSVQIKNWRIYPGSAGSNSGTYALSNWGLWDAVGEFVDIGDHDQTVTVEIYPLDYSELCNNLGNSVTINAGEIRTVGHILDRWHNDTSTSYWNDYPDAQFYNEETYDFTFDIVWMPSLGPEVILGDMSFDIRFSDTGLVDGQYNIFDENVGLDLNAVIVDGLGTSGSSIPEFSDYMLILMFLIAGYAMHKTLPVLQKNK